MYKKITRLLFSCVLLFLTLLLNVRPVTVYAEEIASGNCGGNLRWVLDADGTLTVSGNGDMEGSFWDEPWKDYRQSIKTVIIADGVTSIDWHAFAHYDSLISVIISESVTSIDDGAFSWCDNLSSVIISNGVTSIGDDAFSWCDSLSEIIIPSSVTNIGNFAFGTCNNLKGILVDEDNMTYASDAYGVLFDKEMNTLIMAPGGIEGDYYIPDSVISIGENAFLNCHGFSSITVSSGVISVGGSAFGLGTGCDIIFCGNAPTFSDSAFRNYYSLVHFPVNDPTWTSDVMQDYGGRVLWEAYGEEAGEGTCEETDEDTKEDTSEDTVDSNTIKIENGIFEYNSILEKDGNQLKSYYTFDYDDSWFFNDSTIYNHELARMSIRVAMTAASKKSNYIEKLFDQLELDERTINYPDPTRETIGYAIGSKNVTDENGETITLILVAVRGGGYQEEWASNFKMGTASEHQGFEEAADKVLSGIEKHIEKIGVKNNIKIWITGFSRAAATSNITAHYLNQAAINGTISGISESGIYAYCFECPRTVTEEHLSRTGVDKNIFNIVNPSDLVTMVAPKAWDFNRYGVTYYLPSNELNTLNYSFAFEKMRNEYEKIITNINTDKTVSEVTDFMLDQYSFFNEAVDALASYFVNQSTYVLKNQSMIMDIAANVLGHANELEMGAVEFWLNVVEGVPGFLVSHPVICSRLIAQGRDILFAHYPELCLAWMDSLIGDDLIKDAKTRYLIVNCPVNLSIYDDNDTLMAQIINNEIQEIENSTIGVFIDENDQKIVILPFDEEFEIIVTATGTGTMSYQIQEYDLDKGDATRIVNYYDIEIAEGDELTGLVGCAENGQASEYTLKGSNGIEIAADYDLTNKEIEELGVIVSHDGNGTVSGGGYFTCGEFAKVVAEPEDGYVFKGWYVDNILVSADQEYRFRVESSISILGRFIKNATDKDCVHDWDEGTVKKDATCVERGEEIYTCTLCGELKMVEIPTIDHTYENGCCIDCGELEPNHQPSSEVFTEESTETLTEEFATDPTEESTKNPTEAPTRSPDENADKDTADMNNIVYMILGLSVLTMSIIGVVYYIFNRRKAQKN